MTSPRTPPAAPTAGLAALLLIVFLSALSAQEVIEQIVLKVNGEIFTKSDLEDRQIMALRQMGREYDPAKDPGGAQLRKLLDEITPELMVGVVDEMLTVQRGRELGYTLGDDQFQSILENIKKDNDFKTDEELEAALKNERMTMADLRRNMERSMIASRVQQTEVLGRVAVSDQELRAYYDTHLGEFTTPQTVTLREFLAATPAEGQPADAAADQAARQKAEDVRRRVLAGESFEKLVTDLSDSASRANAGVIGPLNLDELAPDLRKRVEAMKVGEVSEVLRTPRGYQLLMLDSSVPAQITPFQDARDDINNRVFTMKRREELGKYLDRLRAEGIIEWKNKELEKAFQTGLERSKAGAAAAASPER